MILLIAILTVIIFTLIAQNLYYRENNKLLILQKQIYKDTLDNKVPMVLLKKAIRHIEDFTQSVDESGTPFHDCEFINRPDKGYCDFHNWYWEAKDLLGEIEK